MNIASEMASPQISIHLHQGSFACESPRNVAIGRKTQKYCLMLIKIRNQCLSLLRHSRETTLARSTPYNRDRSLASFDAQLHFPKTKGPHHNQGKCGFPSLRIRPSNNISQFPHMHSNFMTTQVGGKVATSCTQWNLTPVRLRPLSPLVAYFHHLTCSHVTIRLTLFLVYCERVFLQARAA